MIFRLLSRGRFFCLIQLLILSSVARAVDCTPPPSGLVGWWPGEGNANDIVSTNNGILMGGATANAPGVVGSAFQFDGTNGYVQIPDSPAFHPTNLTVECWVLFKTLDTPAHGTYPGQDYIVFKQNSQNYEFEGIALEKDRYPPNVGTNDTFCWETASPAGQLIFLESVTTIKTNVWYFVAGVRGSNYIQLYVNGKLEDQATVPFPQDYGNLPLYFGSSGQSFYDCKFGGLLDEVSLYDRALTSNEIAAIYAAGSAGKCRNLQPSSTRLSLSTNLAAYGAPVTFTSMVAGSVITPTGTVAFMDGTNTLGTGALNGSGLATFSTNRLSTAGSPHSVSAVYPGDSDYAASTSSPVALTITAATVTPAVAVRDKTYDGTAIGDISSRSLAGVITGDDVNLGISGTASFSDKNAGTNKAVTVTGLALSGLTANDYQLSATTVTTLAAITAQAITVTATSNSKTYDGTTNALAVPTITAGIVHGTDAASFTEAYDSRDVGTDKTLIPEGLVLDGNGGSNYTCTLVSMTNGTITARPLAVTAVANTKQYDGTINAAAIPVLTSGNLQDGDTAGFTETYDTKDAGTDKTLAPNGTIDDRNGGNNYQVTYVSTNTGVITPADLTVTADNKTRWFGVGNPPLTAQVSGFVAGESTNVLAGSPDLTTSATPGSAPGDYPIDATAGTLGATNYTFSFVNGTLTVLDLPQLNVTGLDGNAFVFSFPGVSGQSYQIQYNSNLVSGAWIPMGALIQGDGSPVFVTNDLIGPEGYYRLNLQP